MMKTKIEIQFNVNEVEKKINGIVGLQGKKRKEAIDTAKANLYNYLRTLNYTEVTRGFLNSFFSDDFCSETRRRVLKVIINELKKEGKIKEEFIYKNITYFKNCPLCCRDYGSYSLMMGKNKGKSRDYQGVYSMSALSIRKVTELSKIKVYTIL